MDLKRLASQVAEVLPPRVRDTLLLRAFGLTKVPMLLFVSPTVVRLGDGSCHVQVPLNRLTKNHVGSMYFGVLAAGADCAAGLLGFYWIKKLRAKKVTLLFKDFHADFHRRAEADVIFTCEDGALIKECIAKVLETGHRVHVSVKVLATTLIDGPEKPVASFTLTMSFKARA